MHKVTALILSFLIAGTAPAFAATDAVGTWTIVERAKTGDIDAQLVITSSGGALSGTYSAAGQSGAIRDLKVEGNEIHFIRHVSTPNGGEADMIYGATIDGDRIDGVVDAGGFRMVPFSGERQ